MGKRLMPEMLTVILFIIYFGAMMWTGDSVIRVWLRQRERDEQSSRYRTVVAEAAVAEMVETVEQDRAFGADDFNDLPKKKVDSCDGQRRKEENLEAAVAEMVETVEQDKAFGADDSND